MATPPPRAILELMGASLGFFHRIRGHLQDKYSGRYIAVLLHEIAQSEPQTLVSILRPLGARNADWEELCGKIRRREVSYNLEFKFDGANGRRRFADLAILGSTGPLVLIEVKEDDLKSLRNEEQLADYLAQAKAGVNFVHLSRFAPDPEDEALIRRASRNGVVSSSLRYRDIHAALGDRPLAKMLRDYLEDIDVGTYRPIERDEDRSLAFCLTQILGFPHQHSLGKLHANESVSALPELIRRMFDNVERIAEWVHQANTALIGQRFTRKLLPLPEFDLPKLARAIEKEQKKDDTEPVARLPGDPGKYISSGAVTFYAVGRIRTPRGAQPKLKKDDYLYVDLGFALWVARGAGNGRAKGHEKAPLVKTSIYAGFYGNRLAIDDTYYWNSTHLKRFPGEARALKLFAQALREALALTHKCNDPAIRATLKAFRVPSA